MSKDKINWTNCEGQAEWLALHETTISINSEYDGFHVWLDDVGQLLEALQQAHFFGWFEKHSHRPIFNSLRNEWLVLNERTNAIAAGPFPDEASAESEARMRNQFTNRHATMA